MNMNSKEAYKKIIEAHNDMLNHFEVNETEVFEGFAVVGIALDKLEKLEKLEKKLGVSIIKVFEALENGAWVKSKEWGLCKWNMPNIFNEYDSRYEPKSNPELQFLKSGKYEYFKLKDYGKTWALTREELDEDDK